MNPYYIESLQNSAQGFGAGLGATQPNGYAFDPAKTGTAMASGLATGGPIGMAVAGVTSVAGQVGNIRRNIDNTQTNFEGASNDMYGRPVYNGQAVNQGFQTIGELDKGKKRAMTWIDPSSRFVFDRKANQVSRGIRNAQNQYNQADVSYRGQMNQMEDYQQRINNDSRLYNLYRSRY